MGSGAEEARQPESIEREIPMGEEPEAETDAAVEPATEPKVT